MYLILTFFADFQNALLFKTLNILLEKPVSFVDMKFTYNIKYLKGGVKNVSTDFSHL